MSTITRSVNFGMSLKLDPKGGHPLSVHEEGDHTGGNDEHNYRLQYKTPKKVNVYSGAKTWKPTWLQKPVATATINNKDSVEWTFAPTASEIDDKLLDNGSKYTRFLNITNLQDYSDIRNRVERDVRKLLGMTDSSK